MSSRPTEPDRCLLALIEAHGRLRIHGLWPEPYTHRVSKRGLDLTALEPLLPELKRHWYSGNSNNEWFWEHEWTHHGTFLHAVAGHLNVTPYEYFRRTLDLYYEVVAQGLEWLRDNASSIECTPYGTEYRLAVTL